MRARTRGARATIARSVAVYVAIMAGAAAIGALVGALVWGEWFIGAGLAACLAAWLALPTGMLEASGAMHPSRTRRCVLTVANTLATRDIVRRRSRRQ
jgi:hypothetical protein